MKKILVLAALLLSTAALAQTSVWKIAHVMAQEGSKGVYVLESSDFQGCLDAFCDKFVDNSLTAAIRGSDALPIEHRYRGDDYARVQLKQKDFAEMEARLWTLPSGDRIFVVKIINFSEDTVAHIYYFSVGPDKMQRLREPEGMNYSFIYNFKLGGLGRDIEVEMEYRQSDTISILDDGTRVLKKVAPHAISVWVDDPDPSGKTNIRATPGGKIVGRLGDPRPQLEDEEDYGPEDDGPGGNTPEVYNPTNGWWQILGYTIDGLDISEGGWIHWSVIAMSTRNYAGQKLQLHKEPSADSPVVGTITKSDVTVRPMDMSPDGEWVKVKTPYGTGWIETNWLCGNPYTTCA